jgi:hypothetical protein
MLALLGCISSLTGRAATGGERFRNRPGQLEAVLVGGDPRVIAATFKTKYRHQTWQDFPPRRFAKLLLPLDIDRSI